MDSPLRLSRSVGRVFLRAPSKPKLPFPFPLTLSLMPANALNHQTLDSLLHGETVPGLLSTLALASSMRSGCLPTTAYRKYSELMCTQSLHRPATVHKQRDVNTAFTSAGVSSPFRFSTQSLFSSHPAKVQDGKEAL